MTYSIDQAYIFGAPIGMWCLLKDGHEIARGDDPVELRLTADLLNMTTSEQRRQALHGLCRKRKAA